MGGGSSGGACILRGNVADAAERSGGDLRGIEKLRTLFAFNGFNENAVGGAGDKVADILLSGEGGHGGSVGFGGCFFCLKFVALCRYFGVIGALPGLAAAFYGSDGGVTGGASWGLNGLILDERSQGEFGHELSP